MKISINSKFIKGPYGGGVIFANYLKDFLEKKGVKVVNNLKDDDIDIILNVNPFYFLKASSFTYLEAYAYKLRHPETVIILRINNSDEARGTNNLNKEFKKASLLSDYVVYISEWTQGLFKNIITGISSSVIHNGGNQEIFNNLGKNIVAKNKLSIVTHHWSSNINKGHDIYKKLNDLLDDKEYKDKFSFTYIGNLSSNIKKQYNNVNIIEVLSGKELARELKKYDIYLTAARNESAGMHHIEGALSGLPLLYINSGSLPEYCKGHGIEFNVYNFEDKLLEMYNNYDLYSEKIRKYDRTAEKMANNYYNLFLNLFDNKNDFKSNKPLLSRIIFYIIIRIYSVFLILFIKISGKTIKLIKSNGNDR